MAFLKTLPLALERDDVVVVHAAWDRESAEKLRSFEGEVIEAYSSFDRSIQVGVKASEWLFESCSGGDSEG